MKQPSKRETNKRSEMLCPNCFNEGLEPNPGYIDEYDGKAALIKATRCPNEDCDYHYGVPEDQIQMQLPDNSVFSKFKIFNLNNLDINTLLVGLFIIISMVIMLTQFGFISIFTNGDSTEFLDSNVEITGELSYDNEPFNEGEIRLVHQETLSENTFNITDDGEYNIEPEKTGEYNVYFDSNNENIASTFEGNLVINDNDEIEEDINDEIELSNIENQEIETQLQNGYYNVPIENTNNLNDDISLEINPIEEGFLNQNIELDSDTSKNISIPSEPENQTIEFNAEETEEEIIESKSFDGDSESISLRNNESIENIKLQIYEESIDQDNIEEYRITENKTEEITVNSDETEGPAIITLKNGSIEGQKQETGIYENNDDIKTIDTEEDSLREGSMILEPVENEVSQQQNGQIEGDSIEKQLDGNTDINNASITFEGGDETDESIVTETIESNADTEPDETILSDIYTATDDDLYELNYDLDILEEESLVDAWYEINDERTYIEEENNEIDLELNENDTLNAGIKTDVDRNGPIESPVDDTTNPIEVTDINVEDKSSDGDIDISVTVENKSDNTENREFTIYTNGEENSVFSTFETGDLEGGETQTYSERNVPTVRGEDTGLNVIHISDSEPKFVSVDEEEVASGKGEANIDLKNIDENRTIEVDTTGDDNYDCEVSSSNGICEFDQDIDSGNFEFIVNENNVNNTEYTFEYTSVDNAEDVEVDIGNNNSIDINHDGVLEESISESIDLPPSETEFNIDTSNDLPIEYAFTWEGESIIDDPVVYHNGEPIIEDVGEITGENKYEIGTLDEGTHSFDFFKNEGSYTAQIEWIEEEQDSYPELLLNGQQECEPQDFAGDLTCSISKNNLSEDENEIDFNGVSSSFDYDIIKEITGIANKMSLENNEESVTVENTNVENSEWIITRDESLLTSGNNSLNLDIPEVDGFEPEGNVNIDYGYDVDEPENLSIIVENSDEESNVLDITDNIQNDDGTIDNDTIDIPKEYFNEGDNRIYLELEQGAIKSKLNISNSGEEITFIQE